MRMVAYDDKIFKIAKLQKLDNVRENGTVSDRK